MLVLPPPALSAQEHGARPGEPGTGELLRERFRSELERLAQDFHGVAGLHVMDLSPGDRFEVLGDRVFPQASAIKIPILLELFRRAESEPELLSRRVEITGEVRTGGSGVLGILTEGGSALSLEDLAITMIVYSDNTATNVLIDLLWMDAVNRLSAELGAPGIVLLPGRPYVLTVMTTWGGEGGALVEAVSRASWDYFSRLAGATPYGNRVPVELLSPGP